MNNNKTELIYYTVNEISEILKIHPSTIRRYIQNGHLKAFKMSPHGRWRISQDVLKSFGNDINNDK